MVKALQEKLALILQVESLANELGVKTERHVATRLEPEMKLEVEVKPEVKAEVKPEIKPEQATLAPPSIDQSSQVTEPVSKDVAGNEKKNPYAALQQGLQAYLGGNKDKALEYFRESRQLNPAGFEKTWMTMTAIPIYQCVARDKYVTETLFPK